MKRASLLALVAFAACADRELVGPTAASPNARISDAVHNAGNAHFYFLPPLVPAPSATGVFDASLDPVVRICEWEGSACGTLVAEFTTSSGPGSETVRLVAEDEHYLVNWHTDQFSLDASKTYRLRVLVAGTELGFADVDVVDDGRELRNVQTGEYVALVNGRTLSIKFRIENGAVFVVGPSGSEVSTPEGSVTLVIPPGAVTSEIGITVTAGIPPANNPNAVPGAFYDFGPDGATFTTPVQLTIQYNPALIPPSVPESTLRLHKVVLGGLVQVPGSTVDPVQHTVTGAISGFSQYGPGWSGNLGWDTVPGSARGRALWGSSANDVFVVGDQGQIFHWDGVAWFVQASGTAQRLSAVWGTGPANVFAAGDGVVLNYDGIQWQTVLQTFVSTGLTVPEAVALGDLNLDGWLDLVVLGRQGAPLYVTTLLGDGAGGFGPPVHTAVPHGGNQILLLDADGDGRLDLVRCHSGAVATLLATGAGSFGAEIVSPLSSGCGAIAGRDLNGDSKVDLVLVAGPSAISTVLGDGAGSFGAERSFPIPNGPRSVVTGDFDGDGFADVALTTWSGPGLAVLQGDGMGGLGPVTEYPAGPNSSSIAAGDFDGNGTVDLAIVHHDALAGYPYTGTVTIHSGLGDGTVASGVPYATDGLSSEVATADLNGDGRLDIVTQFGWGFSVLLNSGSGFAQFRSYGAGATPGGTAFALGDVTGDGRPDIVSAAVRRGIDLLPNTGAGQFRSAGDLLGLWGASATDVYAVGEGETLLHFDGVGWTNADQSESGACSLTGVWGSSASDVLAVGDCGFVHRFNGSGWVRENVAAGRSLFGVWGSASSDVYVVGQSGIALHFDGLQWTTVQLPPPGVLFPEEVQLQGVWGSSGVDVFLVGWESSHHSGHIAHFDGNQWTWQYFGFRDPFGATDLRGVWGTSPNVVWAVGPVRVLHGVP